ncbi:hypothetical protein TRVL_02042 [Trypanosoma vivax]|uniref:Uncharacterized protein n=1 Tax=Trypanosoma vivax (strain Y486) TaxID=1055687 RepID=G0U2R4_TRYVY|nr:hypothetical protein TRVL_02042 [Trypanosoma vivax]CCC50568.1 conserved hypothetical protein [Trypanosoma vivax Y486]
MLAIFKRPHLRACQEYAEIAVELNSLRRVPSFTDFERLLRGELKNIYGEAPEVFRNGIMYSTKSDPCSFACCLSCTQLDMLRDFDVAVEKEQQLQEKYQKAEEDYQRYTEENKDRKPTRKKLIEDEKARKRLKEMKRDAVDAEYEVQKLSKKLANVFDIAAIRVPLC